MLKEIIFLDNIFHIVKKVIAIINDLLILSVGYHYIFTINSITQLDKCINVRTHTHTYIYIQKFNVIVNNNFNNISKIINSLQHNKLLIELSHVISLPINKKEKERNFFQHFSFLIYQYQN